MRADPNDRYERLRAMLVKARTQAGLKQTDVAERLGRPQSYLSKIERGERGLDVIEFLDIAKAIGFDAASFLKKID
jgi:transcriptional regulator with XRE-family HTH domain